MRSIKLTVADMLTLVRLFLSPIIIPLLVVNLIPFNIFYLNVFVAALFFTFGLTDFFDGYLARNYYGTSVFGAIVDPVADKILMFSSFISLLAVQKISVVWVLIFIGREVFVMAIRYFALQNKSQVKVSFFGKMKTALQVILVTVVIVNPDQSLDLLHSKWNMLETALIYGSVFFSLYSAAKYYRVVHNHFVAMLPYE